MCTPFKIISICIYGTIFIIKLSVLGFLIIPYLQTHSISNFEITSQLYGSIGIGILCIEDIHKIISLSRQKNLQGRQEKYLFIFSYSVPIIPIIGCSTYLSKQSLEYKEGSINFLLLITYLSSLFLNLTLFMLQYKLSFYNLFGGTGTRDEEDSLLRWNHERMESSRDLEESHIQNNDSKHLMVNL